MARINYYIQTVFQQLLFYLEDYGLARAITRTFTVLLPLGGIAGKYNRASAQCNKFRGIHAEAACGLSARFELWNLTTDTTWQPRNVSK